MKKVGNITIERKGMLNLFTNTDTGFSIITHMGSEGSALAKSLTEFRAIELRSFVRRIKL